MGRFSGSSSGLILFFLLFSSFGDCAPAQQQGVMPLAERRATAQTFTTERLAVWQNRLNLGDWKINVALARSTELRPRTLGNIHWDLGKKVATIHVLDPADYRLPWNEVLADMEFTVVHELIHLGFAPVTTDFQRSDANRREEEHAVNHMARALLNLDHVTK